MMLCISLGTPPQPPRKKSGPAPSFVGFLYLSFGLALIFAALQQGQRLDWFIFGVFNACFWAGCFFLLFPLFRRPRSPNFLGVPPDPRTLKPEQRWLSF